MSTFGRQSLAGRKNNYLEQREFKNKFLFFIYILCNVNRIQCEKFTIIM